MGHIPLSSAVGIKIEPRRVMETSNRECRKCLDPNELVCFNPLPADLEFKLGRRHSYRCFLIFPAQSFHYYWVCILNSDQDWSLILLEYGKMKHEISTKGGSRKALFISQSIIAFSPIRQFWFQEKEFSNDLSLLLYYMWSSSKTTNFLKSQYGSCDTMW